MGRRGLSGRNTVKVAETMRDQAKTCSNNFKQIYNSTFSHFLKKQLMNKSGRVGDSSLYSGGMSNNFGTLAISDPGQFHYSRKN